MSFFFYLWLVTMLVAVFLLYTLRKTTEGLERADRELRRADAVLRAQTHE